MKGSTAPPKYVSPVQCPASIASVIRSTLDLPHDVVSLAEERKPFLQHRLLLILQIIPVGDAVLGFERRTGQGPGRVLSCKYCAHFVSSHPRDEAQGEPRRLHTMILPAGAVGRVPAHVKDDAFDSHQSWTIWIRAYEGLSDCQLAHTATRA